MLAIVEGFCYTSARFQVALLLAVLHEDSNLNETEALAIFLLVTFCVYYAYLIQVYLSYCTTLFLWALLWLEVTDITCQRFSRWQELAESVLRASS